MKQRNEGFSLVELLVSVAVLSIVTLGIAGLLRLAGLQYSKASTETEVFNLAQSTFVSVSNKLVDAKDLEYDNTAKTLSIANETRWEKFELVGEILYYDEGEYESATDPAGKLAEAKSATVQHDEVNILADHVQQFIVDTSSLGAGLVVLQVGVRYRESQKVLVQNVFIRNKWDEAGTLGNGYTVVGMAGRNAGGNTGSNTGSTPATTPGASDSGNTTPPVTSGGDSTGSENNSGQSNPPDSNNTNPPAPVNPPSTGGNKNGSASIQNNNVWNGNTCNYEFKPSNGDSMKEVTLTYDKPLNKSQIPGSTWCGGQITVVNDYTVKITYSGNGLNYGDGFQTTFQTSASTNCTMTYK